MFNSTVLRLCPRNFRPLVFRVFVCVAVGGVGVVVGEVVGVVVVVAPQKS